ncbi:uncharacterized protein [Cherax quadricarinatus]
MRGPTMCWRVVLKLVLVVEGTKSVVVSEVNVNNGSQWATQPLTGTAMMSALPSSQLMEVAHYGIKERHLPSEAPRHPHRPVERNRKPIPRGSVAINTYYNPTTGLARHPHSPGVDSPRAYPGAPEGSAGTVSVWMDSLPSGKDGKPGTSVRSLDPLEYLVEDEDEAEPGTLQAALHTLWTQRYDAYNTLEETKSAVAAVHHAWDTLQNHHPHSNAHHIDTHSTHNYKPASSTKVFGHRHSFAGSDVGTADVSAAIKFANYGPGKISDGHIQHSMVFGAHHAFPTVGGQGFISGMPLQPEKNQNSIGMNVRVHPAAARPEGRIRSTGAIYPTGISDIASKLPYQKLPTLKQPPRDLQTRLQMVKRRLSAGPAGISSSMGHNTLPTTNLIAHNLQHTDYESQAFPDHKSLDQPWSNIPHLIVHSSTSPGHLNSQASAGNTQTGLSLAEAMPLANLMDHPLKKKLLINSGFKNKAGNGMSTLHQQESSNWMYRMGQMVSGVSKQLPSIDKAVTTMSFLAFGIFMANLVVQAIANTTTLNSLLGREDEINFSGLQLDFSSLAFEFMDNLGLEKDVDDNHKNNTLLKKVAQVISQVYISLHEIARVGMAHLISVLGLHIPSLNTQPRAANLEPGCMQRLLCEGHNITTPSFKKTASYRLLPFWTMGVSWLFGDSNIPKLLEELRAEVAGQQGLDCAFLFPECTDLMTLEKFIPHSVKLQGSG